MAGAPSVPADAPASFYGWRIVAFAVITGALTGPGQTIGVSVFVDHLIADLGLTRSEVSTAYLIGTMLGATTLPGVGRWIDRAGVRTAITAIGAGFGFALIGMSGVGGFLTLALGFTFIRLLGQGALSLASTVAVTHWFDRRRGLAIGIMTTAMSGLMSLVPVGLNLAIEGYGWRTAWLIAAATIWLVVVPIGRWGMIDRPSDVGQLPDGGPAADGGRFTASAPVPQATRAEAVRTYRFWVLTASQAAMALLATALNFHQISLLGEAGLSASVAALMFLPQVLGASAAGLLFGALSDRVPARVLVPAAMLLLAGALGLAAVVAPGGLAITYAVCLGASGGAGRSVNAALLPRWFGVVHIGAIQGLAIFAGVAASAAGPIALSVARDWTGGYGTAAVALIAVPVVIGIAALRLPEG